MRHNIIKRMTTGESNTERPLLWINAEKVSAKATRPVMPSRTSSSKQGSNSARKSHRHRPREEEAVKEENADDAPVPVPVPETSEKAERPKSSRHGSERHSDRHRRDRRRRDSRDDDEVPIVKFGKTVKEGLSRILAY